MQKKANARASTWNFVYLTRFLTDRLQPFCILPMSSIATSSTLEWHKYMMPLYLDFMFLNFMAFYYSQFFSASSQPIFMFFVVTLRVKFFKHFKHLVIQSGFQQTLLNNPRSHIPSPSALSPWFQHCSPSMFCNLKPSPLIFFKFVSCLLVLMGLKPNSGELSQTIPTTLPTIPYPGNTLPCHKPSLWPTTFTPNLHKQPLADADNPSPTLSSSNQCWTQ